MTYTLQLLLVTVLYPIPETQPGTSQKNFYRHFLGRLHRPQDFQFIVDGMTRILNQPFHANTTSYIPGTQAATKFSPEIIMLFWEITQCNKRFRSYMIDTERAHDFLISIIFYATEYKLDASKQGVVRMCAFLLQTLSVEPKFGMKLNKSFDGQNTLPLVIRIMGFRGSYADFLIQVSILDSSPCAPPRILTVPVHLQPHNYEPGQALGYIPCFASCDQQHISVPGGHQRNYKFSTTAAVFVYVIPFVPPSQ